MTYPAPSGFLPNYNAKTLAHYRRLETRAHARDRNHDLIHAVRRGHIRQLFPDELEFSISFNGSPIANFVDIVAHDMAEGIAPLPALACSSGKMETDADQKRAAVKNCIGENYWKCSKLERQMLLKGADWYVTYGFVAFFVEPDTRRFMPRIQVIDPRHSYYELDRYGNTRTFAHRWLKRVDELCALFPEYAPFIRMNPDTRQSESDECELEYVLWVDDTTVSLVLPQRQGMVLNRYEHGLSKNPVVVAERPSDDESPRGQFDDVIWVQVARAIMATLALEAAHTAVQAPIAVPRDMDEFPVGPHAILQADNARDVHKLNLELPAGIFAENAALDAELRLGSRYPEARSGGINASVVTGKGVEALLGTFDSQIKGAQVIFKDALEDVTALCFEMDEKWWPHHVKTVAGTHAGESYEFKYTPAQAINGRYTCTVTYGFAAGLRDPSQAIVTMLQLEGAGLIAKGTTQENLPGDMRVNATREMQKINVESSREALKQGFFALVQASGQMAAQGQDPAPIIQLAVSVIRDLQNGKSVEDSVANAYTALEQQQQAQQQAQAEAMQQAMGGGGPGQEQFEGANGSPEAGVPGQQAPGQAGLPPGGRPTMAEMVAGFRGNGDLPVNQFTVRRSVPTGT